MILTSKNPQNLPAFEELAPPIIEWQGGYLAKWNYSSYRTIEGGVSAMYLTEYPINRNTEYVCLHQEN